MRRLSLLLAVLGMALLPACDALDQPVDNPAIERVDDSLPTPTQPDGKIHVTFSASSASPSRDFIPRAFFVTFGGQTRSMAFDARHPTQSVTFTMDGPGIVDSSYSIEGTSAEGDGHPRGLTGQQQFEINEDDHIQMFTAYDQAGYLTLQLGRQVPSFKVAAPSSPGVATNERPCGSCSGTGKINCGVCKSLGTLKKWIRNSKPTDADEYRSFPCWNCSGTGQKNCFSCGGDGRK